jgi:predicted MPP superfamily phosphohydrolase
MPIHGLPPNLAGKVLAQISDLHIGRRVDPNYIASALRYTCELSPDMLVITGDIIHGNDGVRLKESVKLIQENLATDRIPTVVAFGNHDYGARWGEPRVADELASRLRDTGIRVLRNESTNLAGLNVTGLDDRWGTNWQPELATELIKQSKPSIVLAHNPDVCDEPIWKDYSGWILSGHTHGGQCKPPFLPPPLIPVMNRRYTAGYFELSGDRRLYINRALGYLHRVRFLVRPEITLFTLQAA